jgi:hypothetical protein
MFWILEINGQSRERKRRKCERHSDRQRDALLVLEIDELRFHLALFRNGDARGFPFIGWPDTHVLSMFNGCFGDSLEFRARIISLM